MNNKSRRNFLIKTGYGLGGLTVSGLLPGGGVIASALANDAALSAIGGENPLAAKAPHFAAKAKTVIWLHMAGAPSTLDLYDYKPELVKRAGTPIPESFLKGIKTSTQGGITKLIATNRTWKQHGQSGAWFSDWLPNLAEHADDLAFIKSSVTVGATHDISIMKLNSGGLNPGRPTLGAWIQYALGSANHNLPAYVVLYNDKREPRGGVTNWDSGFLPAVYQGTPFRPGDSPILHLQNPQFVADSEKRNALDLLRRLNESHSGRYPGDTELQARTASYDLAYRMQETAPEAVDFSKESEATKKLYGLDDEVTRPYGELLLRARRLTERGVRFVQVVSGPTDIKGDSRDWDAHQNIEDNHSKHSKIIDKPIAGLLKDLKAKGMLDDTLVVWTSEFGRTPWSESGDGRDHNPWGYTQWIAGGGIKAGYTHGATDELGVQAAKGTEVDTYDLHATILNQLGLDHLKLIYKYQGRSERPTVVYGKVIKELVA